MWVPADLLCQLAFAAFGATTMGHLLSSGVPWLPALVLCGLATVPVGALVAVPAMRVSGIYLALLTIGFGIFMQSVVYGWGIMFGAGQAARAHRPTLGFVDAATNQR